MLKLRLGFAVGTVCIVFGAITAGASLRPDRVSLADSKKTEAYVRDGLVVGGDRAIDDVAIREIRRASNAAYERIVIDLEGTRAGEPAAIPRPPYFQVAVSPDEKRLIFTIFGHPKLNFDAKKVVTALKKSKNIESVELFPRLEDQSWTFAINLKAGKPVEVFELTNPVRIIADIRNR